MSGAPRPVAHVFCGTSEFAATVLGVLAGSQHRPALVVTPPDRKRGRGRRMQSPPAAEAARDLGIDLHQTESINEEGSRRAVLAVHPELATVCAFGQLIKDPLLSELPMLNVHPSLLPRWRGAAPIERAIMAGDERTGACVIRLTEGLDSGPVALRLELAIESADDYGSLAQRLAELGARALIEALDLHASGRLDLVEQDEEGVTYAEKIEPAERRVDPLQPASHEARRVRALSPHIGAFADLRGEGGRLGIRSVDVLDEGPPFGAFTFDSEAGLLHLGCSPGGLRIAEVKPVARGWMTAPDYVRGYGVPVGAETA